MKKLIFSVCALSVLSLEIAAFAAVAQKVAQPDQSLSNLQAPAPSRPDNRPQNRPAPAALMPSSQPASSPAPLVFLVLPLKVFAFASLATNEFKASARFADTEKVSQCPTDSIVVSGSKTIHSIHKGEGDGYQSALSLKLCVPLEDDTSTQVQPGLGSGATPFKGESYEWAAQWFEKPAYMQKSVRINSGNQQWLIELTAGAAAVCSEDVCNVPMSVAAVEVRAHAN